MDIISTVDLISGPFPVLLAVLACACGAWLLLRRLRGWILSVVSAALLAAALAWTMNWYVVHIAGLSAYDLPGQVIAWIGAGIFAILLMVLNLTHSRRWRKALAPVAMAIVVVAVAAQINVYYGAYRTIGDVTGASTKNIAPFARSGAKGTPPAPGLVTPATGPVVNHWVKPAGLPGTGIVNSVQIPGHVSGFTGRTAYIYLPPAYQAKNAPLLPVLVLIPGQPGSPADWLKAGHLQPIMDAFATTHQGLAPVVVVPDVNGSSTANTMCMDSQIAKTDTYLAVDVPAWIKNTLNVNPNPHYWAIGGFSFGGTCALQMAVLHPKTYPSAIDLSGEVEPALSADRKATVRTAFGGDTAAFNAVTPLAVMAKNKYPDSWMFLAAGAQDGRFTGYVDQVSTAARSAGITVKTHSVPGAGHSWGVPLKAMNPALTWLAPRLGLAP
ncbi:alpha/beta hydrolase-fold protein [Arthrobacter sp. LAPM80]|uniref:alpha/beta hydrolase n=1 Tax=Arthrobacter sp. LAPM80 TaxID=3141788 RepID=UPI00398B35F9